MDKIVDGPGVSADWIEALAESEADIAAGRTVPLEPVLARIMESLERMEAARGSARS